MKLRVWIESSDNASFVQEDYIELPNNLSDDELEEIAKQVAMNHVEWGYERVNDNGETN